MSSKNQKCALTSRSFAIEPFSSVFSSCLRIPKGESDRLPSNRELPNTFENFLLGNQKFMTQTTIKNSSCENYKRTTNVLVQNQPNKDVFFHLRQF